jgi:hypothetical protein
MKPNQDDEVATTFYYGLKKSPLAKFEQITNVIKTYPVSQNKKAQTPVITRI